MQQEIYNFSFKDDNGELWVKVIIVTFLDAVATVNGRYRTQVTGQSAGHWSIDYIRERQFPLNL